MLLQGLLKTLINSHFRFRTWGLLVVTLVVLWINTVHLRLRMDAIVIHIKVELVKALLEM